MVNEISEIVVGPSRSLLGEAVPGRTTWAFRTRSGRRSLEQRVRHVHAFALVRLKIIAAACSSFTSTAPENPTLYHPRKAWWGSTARQISSSRFPRGRAVKAVHTSHDRDRPFGGDRSPSGCPDALWESIQAT